MFVFMMLAVWMWSRDDRAGWFSRGWLETARKASFDQLVRAPAGSAPAGPPAAPAVGRAGIDDDEHLAAYNEYLARLNSAVQPRDHTAG
jgi:hypothetical protein